MGSGEGEMLRQFSHILIGAIYYPPDVSYFITANQITSTSIENILRKYPYRALWHSEVSTG